MEKSWAVSAEVFGSGMTGHAAHVGDHGESAGVLGAGPQPGAGDDQGLTDQDLELPGGGVPAEGVEHHPLATGRAQRGGEHGGRRGERHGDHAGDGRARDARGADEGNGARRGGGGTDGLVGGLSSRRGADWGEAHWSSAFRVLLFAFSGGWMMRPCEAPGVSPVPTIVGGWSPG